MATNNCSSLTSKLLGCYYDKVGGAYRLFLLLLFLCKLSTTSVGQDLPDTFDYEFANSLEKVEKFYPEQISYYAHPTFSSYQFRGFWKDDQNTDNLYTVWDKGKLIKVIPGESHWNDEYIYLRLQGKGQSFSGVYYASLIENNVLNIKAENKFFIDEVKMQLGITPRPKKSPQLIQSQLLKWKKDLAQLDRMYASKKISKADYLKEKTSLLTTGEWSKSKKTGLTSTEKARASRFVSQLKQDYPFSLSNPTQTIRIDNLSFAHIIFTDSSTKKIPIAAFKLTFSHETNYKVSWKITLLTQAEYRKIEGLVKESSVEDDLEEITL